MSQHLGGQPRHTRWKKTKTKQEKKNSQQDFRTSQRLGEPISQSLFKLFSSITFSTSRAGGRGGGGLTYRTDGSTDGWRASAAVRLGDQISHIYSGVATQPHLLFMEKTTSSDQSDGRTPPEISRPAARRGAGPDPTRSRASPL